jgi:hypothetical protein
MLEPDKISPRPFYITWIVSELGGLEFDARSRIFPLHVIPAYRSPYSGAHVA